jgi:cellobiose phosphorylase
VEPYVISADIYSAYPHSGRGGWSWYTGAAAWYYKAMIEHVLGIELTDGFSALSVNPITEYKAEIAYNNYKLAITADRTVEEVLLDGGAVTFPLVIPDGEHTLSVPVKI